MYFLCNTAYWNWTSWKETHLGHSVAENWYDLYHFETPFCVYGYLFFETNGFLSFGKKGRYWFFPVVRRKKGCLSVRKSCYVSTWLNRENDLKGSGYPFWRRIVRRIRENNNNATILEWDVYYFYPIYGMECLI